MDNVYKHGWDKSLKGKRLTNQQIIEKHAWNEAIDMAIGIAIAYSSFTTGSEIEKQLLKRKVK